MRRYRIFLCAVFFVLIFSFPIGILLGSLLSGSGNLSDIVAGSDFFAMTDAAGSEYVYRPTDEIYRAAAAAFSAASVLPAGDGTPTESDTAPVMLVEWIKGDRAEVYRLRCSFSPLRAVLTDREDRSYLLRTEDALFFLGTEAGACLLRGEDPPALTVFGRTLLCSAAEWIRHFADADGNPISLSSGEYLNSAVPSAGIDPDHFSPVFAEPPSVCRYTLFLEGQPVGEGEDLSLLEGLSAGNYQLVLTATWETSALTVRAAYSFVFVR